MKILKVEVRQLRLPMIHSFETSFGRIDHKETVIVKLYTDGGLVGYGEAAAINAPVYTHETVAACFNVLREFVAPQILGKEFQDAASFRMAYENIVGNNAAKAGIECAFWHLLSLRDNISLKRLFHGVQDEIITGEVVGIQPTVREAVGAARKIVGNGYRRLKIKIKPGQDVAIVEAIRMAFPNIQLSVDANAAYTLANGLEVFKRFEEFNLEMIEQPFARDNLLDHAALQRQIRTPICLDESIESVEDARVAIALDACKIINIKPSRVGGILESMAIHDLAIQRDVGVWCGGMGETGIGRAFNIALASKVNFVFPADMSPYQFFYKEDLVSPSYEIKANGCIDVSDTPGLGYCVNDVAIDAYTISKAELSTQ